MKINYSNYSNFWMFTLNQVATSTTRFLHPRLRKCRALRVKGYENQRTRKLILRLSVLERTTKLAPWYLNNMAALTWPKIKPEIVMLRWNRQISLGSIPHLQRTSFFPHRYLVHHDYYQFLNSWFWYLHESSS